MEQGDPSADTPKADRLRRAADAAKSLVAFDFDGTLTVSDSFTAFLKWRAGALRYALGLASLAPAAAQYLVRRDRGRIKAAATRRFLTGLPRQQLASEASRFAQERFAQLMRPDALAAWADWQAKGATVVIVTASPTEVVRPFAERLGADALIGTEMAFDAADRASGGFSTPNCRGAEKVRRLRAHFGANLRLTAAYGDTSGDREMLQMAEQARYRVFTARP